MFFKVFCSHGYICILRQNYFALKLNLSEPKGKSASGKKETFCTLRATRYSVLQLASRDLQTRCGTLEALLSSSTPTRATGTWLATTPPFSSLRTPCWSVAWSKSQHVWEPNVLHWCRLRIHSSSCLILTLPPKLIPQKTNYLPIFIAYTGC